MFDDSETFQKERPTKLTEVQTESMYSNIADEIINDYRGSNKEGIIKDLKSVWFNDSGFEIAKEMEDGYGTYKFDGDLISFLDDLGFEKRRIISANVKEWVKAHDIKPTLKKGDIITMDRRTGLDTESNIYITGFRIEEGCYLVHNDIDRNGGVVLPYEAVKIKE